MGLPVILPGMALRDFLKPRFLDWAMRMMDDLRPEALEAAEGEVLEVGFGTGRNLEHYGAGVRSLTAVDPMDASSVPKVGERIARAPFPLERCTLRADGELPFDAGRFDSIVTTWTLCSIPEVARALAEMRGGATSSSSTGVRPGTPRRAGRTGSTRSGAASPMAATSIAASIASWKRADSS